MTHGAVWRVLVAGPSGAGWTRGLWGRLDPTCYEVVGLAEGARVLDAVVDETPDVVVFGLGSGETAPEGVVALLRRMRPEVRVIAVAERSTSADAAVVEAGVFYYTASPSAEEVALAVEAAVQSIGRARKGSGRWGRPSS